MQSKVRADGQRRSQAAPKGKVSPDPSVLNRALDRAAAAPRRRELALALARAGEIDEARDVLRDLLMTTPADSEMLGLIGHINKELSARSADAEEARMHLQTALDFYLDGYNREQSAYCGINAASLHALLGHEAESKALAGDLLAAESCEDVFWAAALQAEASLLLGRVEEAGKFYKECCAMAEGRADDVQTVWNQARRLCAFLHDDAALLDASFGAQQGSSDPVAEKLQALRPLLEVPGDGDGKDRGADDAEVHALRRLARDLLKVQEEQRHALSRELHDNIAQCLSAATNRIALARTLARTSTSSRKLQRELADVRGVLEQTLDAVGVLSRSLRPVLLDCEGLADAIERHASAFRDRVKMALHVECHAPSAHHLDGERATSLFRIAQEALNNIEKHAQATEARLKLLEHNGNICLEISDNGRSFHPDHAAEAGKNGHIGLASMRERAEMLGGTLEIKADPGNGTTVKAAVPVNGNSGK